MQQDMNIEELYEAGYRQGFPHWGLIDGSDIDIGICADCKCSECGHKGLECKPFIKDNPRSYRAFAVCPECHSSFEF